MACNLLPVVDHEARHISTYGFISPMFVMPVSQTNEPFIEPQSLIARLQRMMQTANYLKIPENLVQARDQSKVNSSDPEKLREVKRVLEISDILDIIRTCPSEFFIYSVILSEFKNVFNPHCPANLLFSSIIRSYSCLFMTNQSVHTLGSKNHPKFSRFDSLLLS